MTDRAPAYQRLDVDERRRRLLELGADLFTRHTYAELSMAAIAREAGISKALLYHYFPSKQAYFVATLEQQAEELVAARSRSTPRYRPVEQLTRALDAFLGWVEENAEGYGKLLEGATTHAEVRELVDGVRAATAERILAGLAAGRAAAARAARGRERLALVHGRRAHRLARAPRHRAATSCSGSCSARCSAPSPPPGRPASPSASPGLADLLEVDDEDQRLVRRRCPGSGSARRRRGRAGSRAAGGRRASSPRRPGPSRGSPGRRRAGTGTARRRGPTRRRTARRSTTSCRRTGPRRCRPPSRPCPCP